MDSDGDGVGDVAQLAAEQKAEQEAEQDAADQKQLLIIIGVIVGVIVVAAVVFLMVRKNDSDISLTKELEPISYSSAPGQRFSNPVGVSVGTPVISTPEPEPVQVIEPTILQQWTDEAGHTWAKMSDGSTKWWNGTDWQDV